MSTDYIEAYLNKLISTEGGFTNDVRDAGHKLRVSKGDKWDSYCTNFGITQFTLSEAYGRQASEKEVEDLTVVKAKSIYLQNYFYKYMIDEVATPLQLLMLDMVVQHKYAIRLIQQTINATHLEVRVDNIMGPSTLLAINSLSSSMGGYFTNMIVYTRIEYYDVLGRSSGWAMGGWLNRAEKFIVFPEAGSAVVKRKLKLVRQVYGLV